MSKREIIISVVLYLDHDGQIQHNITLNPNASMSEISKLLTKEIVKLGEDSREKERRSKVLMDVRSMLDRYE